MSKVNLKQLEGKKIKEVLCGDWYGDDSVVVVCFTDGSFWVVTSERTNAAGTSLIHRFNLERGVAPRENLEKDAQREVEV